MSNFTATSPIATLDTERLLAYGIAKWNVQPGAVWNIRGEWNPEGWQLVRAHESRIFDGEQTLRSPGPFKKLGAFAVLNQYWPSYRLTDAFSGQPLDPEAMTLWAPRLTLWLMPFYFQSLVLNGNALPLKMECPTPHFQADLIGYLRSLYNLLAQDAELRTELELITERSLVTGLIIEAATYASTSGMAPLRPFLEASGNCFERCDPAIKDELMIDLVFNEPKFLSDATDIGLD